MDKTKTILYLGFSSILGLMILFTAIGLTVIDTSYKRIENIVHTNNLKVELITRMRTAARERTVSIQKMMIMPDAFDRADEWERFSAFGAEFIVARETMRSMELSKDEIDLLNKQDAIIKKVGPLQISITELIRDGKESQAHLLILNQAIPLQDQAFTHMTQLRNILADKAKTEVEYAEQDHQRALSTMLVLSGSVVIISIMIAIFVVRRTSQSERKLSEEKERALITLYSIGDGVITTDANGDIQQMNPAAEVLTGWESSKAAGSPLLKVLRIVRESDRHEITNPLDDVLRNGNVSSSESDNLLVRYDDQEFAIEHTVAPIFSSEHQVLGAILVFRNVTETRTLSRQLSYQACHDALTGLHNRRELEKRLEEVLTEVRRYPNNDYWLCYIDLDQFKVINDTCGHLAGDELIKQVARCIKDQIRESDLVARMGGDEFAILLKHCEENYAHAVVERVRKELQELRFAWDKKSFSTSASIGMVSINSDSGSLYDLLSAADTACYVAKDEGRNRIHIYQRNDDVTARREGEMEMVHRINRALEDDRFVLYFQRIQSLKDDAQDLHGEILIRMLDEKRDIVPPMAFIPAAERYNLMTQIDRWVIQKTLEKLQQLTQNNAIGDHLVSINLSAQSICDDDFLPFLLGQLDQSPIKPESLCFEVTETAAIANLSSAIQFITSVKKRGCRFSLDDFGSGLSSFGYLKNLPVDFLKIDGGFVRDILDDNMDLALVESINQIGHVMGIKTIAEYVENDEIIALLQAIGVDYGQGYGIEKPLPLDDIMDRLLPSDATQTSSASKSG